MSRSWDDCSLSFDLRSTTVSSHCFFVVFLWERSAFSSSLNSAQRFLSSPSALSNAVVWRDASSVSRSWDDCSLSFDLRSTTVSSHCFFVVFLWERSAFSSSLNSAQRFLSSPSTPSNAVVWREILSIWRIAVPRCCSSSFTKSRFTVSSHCFSISFVVEILASNSCLISAQRSLVSSAVVDKVCVSQLTVAGRSSSEARQSFSSRRV